MLSTTAAGAPASPASRSAKAVKTGSP